MLQKKTGTYENCEGQIATTSLRTGLAMTHQEVRYKLTAEHFKFRFIGLFPISP